jgi:type I restriction enzyme S subunit
MFNLAQGATRYNLSKSYFEKTIITIPILSEQTAIATILSDMDAEIEALQAKLSKAKLVKQGAMQELLTGKIRLMNTSSQSQKLSENRIIPITAHVVGGHVVNKLYGSRGWGRTKLQKSMHLIDYHCQLDFGYEYIRNIAGPDSQALMNHIDSKFRQYRHVRIEIKNDGRGGKHYNYIPTSMITEIEQVFNSYSTETQEAINNLLNKIKKMDLARAEIVSTLYAVWNNRIIKKQPINDGLLLRDFYDWSAHKSDYSQDLVLKGLNYMRKEGIIPIGWGKYIDKKITL